MLRRRPLGSGSRRGMPRARSSATLPRQTLRFRRWVQPPRRGTIIVTTNSYMLQFEFFKPVRDTLGQEGVAIVWNVGEFGTHGDHAAFLITRISALIDRFLVEYLRVNGETCR